MEEKRTRRANGEGCITHRTDGRWVAVIQVPLPTGGSKRRALYGKTRAEVELKLETFKRQLGLALQQKRPPKWSFEAYACEWLAQQKVYVKPRTLELYTRELRTLVFPHIGAIPLVNVTTQHIRDMQFAWADAGKRDSARRSRDCASRVLKCAAAEGLIPKNPADGVRKLPQKVCPREIWNAQEVRAFLEAAQDHPLYAYFYLSLFTGMRPGELRALEWDCVTKDHIFVKQTATTSWNREKVDEPKTPAGQRYIPLHRDSWTVLEAHARGKKHKGYVFGTGNGTIMTLSNLRLKVFLPLIEKAGVKRVEMYAMRHTFASMHIAAGTDVAKLAKWMGHTNPGFTMRYYVHAFDRLKQGPDLSAAELLGLIDDTPEVASCVPSSGTTLKLTLSPAQREALLRGEPLTLELGAG